MSLIDDYRTWLRTCERLSAGVPQLSSLRPADIEVKLSPEIKSLLCEMLARPETTALLERMILEKIVIARNAAIGECQDFLRMHVVEEVMEG